MTPQPTLRPAGCRRVENRSGRPGRRVVSRGRRRSKGSTPGSRQPATRTGRCFAAFEGAATSKAIQGAGCQSTPSAVSSAAGRPLSASRAGYPVTVSGLGARNRWQPAGPRLSRCRRRAGGSRRRCRATMHGASWLHGAPWPASATVADKAMSLLGVGVSTLPLETAGQGETKRAVLGVYTEAGGGPRSTRARIPEFPNVYR